jgi:hypothetical protein
MSVWLLGLVAAIYVYVAFGYFVDGRIGMGLAFGAYAFSNVGFILDALKR